MAAIMDEQFALPDSRRTDETVNADETVEADETADADENRLLIDEAQ